MCMSVCVAGGQKANGDEQDRTEGKKVEKGVTTRVKEGQGGGEGGGGGGGV